MYLTIFACQKGRLSQNRQRCMSHEIPHCRLVINNNPWKWGIYTIISRKSFIEQSIAYGGGIHKGKDLELRISSWNEIVTRTQENSKYSPAGIGH